MRALVLTAFLTACAANSELEPPAIAAPEVVEQAPETALARYSTALCRLYTEPSCVDAQKRTCPAPLAFGSVDECTGLLTRTADGCTRSIEAILADHATALDACEASLDSFACETDDFCTESGKADASGACQEIAAAVSAECPMLEDDA